MIDILKETGKRETEWETEKPHCEGRNKRKPDNKPDKEDSGGNGEI